MSPEYRLALLDEGLGRLLVVGGFAGAGMMDRLAIETGLQRQMLGVVDVALDVAERDRRPLRQRHRHFARGRLTFGIRHNPGDHAEIDAAAHELALSLAQGPSIALGYIKRNINNAETMSLEACFDGEALHHARAGETADHKEAAKAFVEKRKPVFQGK